MFLFGSVNSSLLSDQLFLKCHNEIDDPLLLAKRLTNKSLDPTIRNTENSDYTVKSSIFPGKTIRSLLFLISNR
jgi:hypothetical protein